jgi:hypothetical protein
MCRTILCLTVGKLNHNAAVADVAFSLAAGRHPAALASLRSICAVKSADLAGGTVVAEGASCLSTS